MKKTNVKIQPNGQVLFSSDTGQSATLSGVDAASTMASISGLDIRKAEELLQRMRAAD